MKPSYHFELDNENPYAYESEKHFESQTAQGILSDIEFFQIKSFRIKIVFEHSETELLVVHNNEIVYINDVSGIIKIVSEIYPISNYYPPTSYEITNAINVLSTLYMVNARADIDVERALSALQILAEKWDDIH